MSEVMQRGVHGGIGFGTRNAEGERILKFGDATHSSRKKTEIIIYQTGA